MTDQGAQPTGGTTHQPGDSSGTPPQGTDPQGTLPQGTDPQGTPPSGDTGTNKAGEAEFKLNTPEGVNVEQADIDAFTALAKEVGLKPDAAQKLLDFEVKRLQAAEEKLAETVTKWREEIAADKDIGGEKLQENLAVARKVFQTYFDAETVKMAAISGFGDHPGVVRGFIKLAKALSEDNLGGAGSGSPSGSRPASDEDLALQLFPSMKQA